MSESVGERLSAMDPGSVQHGAWSLGTMASGQPLAIPYSVFRGDRVDPCLWVNGIVHGNEAPAAIAAVMFGRALDPAWLRGSVVITPVANPTALNARVKHSPYDGVDLDQSFPGRGMLMTERVAQRLFDTVAPAVTHAVNLHTMAEFMDATRYCVYKEPPNGRVAEQDLLREMACFDPYVACRMDLSGSGELPGNIAGALDYQLLMRGVHAFMVELGSGGHWDGRMIDGAVDSFVRLARVCGVLSDSSPGSDHRQPAHGASSLLTQVRRRTHLVCDSGGFFRANVAPGQTLAAGHPIGHIVDVRGDCVPAPSLDVDVSVIGVRQDPIVHPGDRVGFVAFDGEQVPVS